MFWRPSVKEISDWVGDTYLKFAEQENKDPHHRSDMGVIVDLLSCFHFFDGLEGSSTVFYGLLKLEEPFF